MKFAGSCNDQKHALNACLRGEVCPAQLSPPSKCRNAEGLLCFVLQRLDRTKKNQDAAKERRKEVEKKWKEIEQDS